MNIVHVISSLSSDSGGPPVVAAGLAGAQAALGHRVTLATIDEPSQPAVPVPPGVTVRAFPLSGKPRYAASAGLDRFLREAAVHADLFHVHSVWQFPTFAAARACWRANKPYVVLLNGMLEEYSVKHRSYAVKTAYWWWRERRVLGRAAGLHCLNAAEIDRAMPWIRAMPKFIVGNGVNGGVFDALPARGAFRAAHPEFADRPLALFLSRLHPKKGLERFLPHWKQVLAAAPRAMLAIAGSGEASYVAEIDRIIAEQGLGESVRRVGMLGSVAKWQALVDADVFVLPSHQEGFSMAITEALAAACPVAITPECNFDEVRSADAGVVVPVADMPGFAAGVAALLADPARRSACGARGQALVRDRFTWEHQAARLQAIYQQILAGKRLAPDGREPVLA